MKDAYSQPRASREGCQHFQGKCKCDIPYHLRESTSVELQRELLRNAGMDIRLISAVPK